jgi:hypothetical protein
VRCWTRCRPPSCLCPLAERWHFRRVLPVYSRTLSRFLTHALGYSPASFLSRSRFQGRLVVASHDDVLSTSDSYFFPSRLSVTPGHMFSFLFLFYPPRCIALFLDHHTRTLRFFFLIVFFLSTIHSTRTHITCNSRTDGISCFNVHKQQTPSTTWTTIFSSPSAAHLANVPSSPFIDHAYGYVTVSALTLIVTEGIGHIVPVGVTFVSHAFHTLFV